MLEPILTTIVLTIVFGTLFGNNDKEFPLYILCGRLVYSFFATGTKTASKSIRLNAAMIKKAIIPLLLLFILTFGVGMILTTINVFFRDMEYIWEVLLMLIMYSSAIFYYPERLMNSGYAWILKWNPLYCMIQSFRNAMFGEAMDMGLTAYAAVCSIVVLILGVICFYKKQDDFILQI